ncbi:type III secretion system chaperone [Thalassomonas viridans]|uniref:Type III secretion system chaperone n=1 Tax=Thalassomonas viridans TaxID=137584 RepID=A0AAE9ZCB4_9GAMM|nr:type III secretion system chaperone [Thalassomonas viridans]WDE08588.1 type III secretion system chaperone [Thalassomonas viridans]
MNSYDQALLTQFTDLIIETCELANWDVTACEVSGNSTVIVINDLPIMFAVIPETKSLLFCAYLFVIEESQKNTVFEQLLTGNHQLLQTSGMTLSYATEQGQGYAALNYCSALTGMTPENLTNIITAFDNVANFWTKQVSTQDHAPEGDSSENIFAKHQLLV